MGVTRAKSFKLGLRRATAPLLARVGALVLRSRWLTPTAARGLWSWLDRYVSFLVPEISTRTRFGDKMRVSPRHRVENELFYVGEWEPLFTRYMTSTGKRHGIFVDIGANIGYFSLIASRFFDHVHSIEASPSIVSRLRQHIDMNRRSNVTIHAIAVGDEPGEVAFHLDTEQSGGSGIEARAGREFEAIVPQQTITAILSDVKLDEVRFIKIDVEGSEAAVLDSLLDVAEHLNDVEVMVEFHPLEDARRMDRLWTSLNRFTNIGFRAFRLQGVYDRLDYLDASARTSLAPLTSRPDASCDILMRREH